MGNSTFYKWRAKYGGMNASLMARMQELKDEIIQEAMAKEAMIIRDVSVSLICSAFLISETYYRYQPNLNSDNELIVNLLVGLTQNKRNWSFGLCFLYLRNVKGYHWNQKCVYRIYRYIRAKHAHKAS
jgi:putative transposase